MALSVFKGLKTLLAGEVVWRSSPVCATHSGTYEIIVKDTGSERLVVFKNKVRSGEYQYEVFEPSVAMALGEALIEGAQKAVSTSPIASGV